MHKKSSVYVHVYTYGEIVYFLFISGMLDCLLRKRQGRSFSLGFRTVRQERVLGLAFRNRFDRKMLAGEGWSRVSQASRSNGDKPDEDGGPDWIVQTGFRGVFVL